MKMEKTMLWGVLSALALSGAIWASDDSRPFEEDAVVRPPSWFFSPDMDDDMLAGGDEESVAGFRPRWDGSAMRRWRGHDGRRVGPPSRPGMGRMGMRRGWGGHGHASMMTVEFLDLTPDQREKVKALRVDSFKSMLDIREKLADAGKELRKLRRDENAGYDAIQKAHEDLGKARGEMAVQMRKSRDQFRAILTPEQIKKLDDMRERRFERGRFRDHGRDRDHDGDRDGWRRDRDRDHDRDRDRDRDRDGKKDGGKRMRGSDKPVDAKRGKR